MSLQHLSFPQIDELALQTLVTSAACESKTLEFKRHLQIATDEQKREFLSDVTALANSDGGDLIFGMEAEKGVAKALVGLRSFVPDDRINQIENLLRDFVQPRLSGIQIAALPLSDGSNALLIRAPRSFAAPHMVRHQGVTRFCGRNSAGKYDLDVNELRSAFLASEGLSSRLKNFRLDRINKLASGGVPVALTGAHFLVLHLLPVVSGRPDVRLTTSAFQKVQGEYTPRPIGSAGWGRTFNIDGLLVRATWGVDAFHGYVQIFRNGFLEAVESSVLTPQVDGQKIIPSIAWERDILDSFPSYLQTMAALELPPPYVVSLSLLNVRGYTMFVGPRYSNWGAHPVDRDHLLTDDILIESLDESPELLLRPLLDQIWNGCGWPGSLNYDKDGKWREHS